MRKILIVGFGDVAERLVRFYAGQAEFVGLARLAWAALFRGRGQRIYHAVDAHPLKMADWFDSCADAFGPPRPPRVERAEAEKQLSEALLSFLRESRQLSNVRTTKELRLKYRYPTSDDLLREVRQRFVASNTPGQVQLP